MSRDLIEVLTKPAVDPVLAGRVIGIGRSATYRAIRDGSLPSFKVGSMYRVPSEPLLRQLGLDSPEVRAAALRRAREAVGGEAQKAPIAALSDAEAAGAQQQDPRMKNPANRGATAGLSMSVASQADSHGYASTPGALQARALIERHRVRPALAATIAALAYAVPETWGARS